MAGKKEFYYDIVFCLDKTIKNSSQLSFIASFIETFKDHLNNYLSSQYKLVDGIRLKIIEFGDYNVSNNAVVDHGFYNLPDQHDELLDMLDGMFFMEREKYAGFSSGLEALSVAINSDWRKIVGHGRHSIILFTLNKPLAIEESVNLENYPSKYPKSLQELKDLWNKSKMDRSNKMLTLFCNMEKDKSSWFPISQWDKAIAIDTLDVNDYNSDFIMETLLIDII